MIIVDKTGNLISDANSLKAKDSNGNFIDPSTYVTSWTSTNSVISVNSATYVYPLQYSLKVQPVDENSTIVLSLHGIIPDMDLINGGSAQFHCQSMATKGTNFSVKLTSTKTATITGAVKVGNNVTYTSLNAYSVGDVVTVTGITPSGLNCTGKTITARTGTTFTVVNAAATGTYSSGGYAVVTPEFAEHAQNATPDVWTPVFSPVIDIGVIDTNAYDLVFDIDISVTDHSGQVFYISVPTLMNELGFLKNNFVANMRKFVPTFIWDKDKIQEYPNYPFAKLFDVLTRAGNHSTLLYSRFYNYMNYQLSTKNREASFRYSQLVDPTHVDSDYRNWLSHFNGTRLYSSITASNAAEVIDDIDESITWQLENAYFGRNAGSVEAIRECTKQVLTGNKVVYVFPGGSFFQINVYTLLSETPGVVSQGDTSPEVESVISKTKPMGFILNHEAYTTLPLILDSSIFGTLGVAALG
jgi:hypothetical protein